MGNFKSFKKVVLLVMLVVFTASIGMSVVTPVYAAAQPGITTFKQIGGGGGASVVDEETGLSAKYPSKTVYFGSFWQNTTKSEEEEQAKLSNYTKEGIKWRVLANDETNGVLLLSDQGLYADQFNSTTEKGHDWNGSDIQKTLNGTGATPEKTTFKGDGTVDKWGSFAGDAFDAKELGAIKDTTNADVHSTDKLFLLSGYSDGDGAPGGEVYNTAYGFSKQTSAWDENVSLLATATVLAQKVVMYGNGTVSNESAMWWLRSPSSYVDDAFFVHSDGSVYAHSVNDDRDTVRPALNLNPASVLFLSAAVGGKGAVNAGDGFTLADVDTSADTFDGWKVTLKDTSIKAPTKVTVTQTKTSETVDQKAQDASEGDTIDLSSGLSVTYGNPTVKATATLESSADYVSAILKDVTEGSATNGQYVQYAKVSSDASELESGVKVAIDKKHDDTDYLVDGTYTMYVFAEKTNGDKETDYASDFSNAEGYTIGNGDVTIFADKLSATHKGKELTANLDNDFNLSFDSDTYNTSVALANNATGTITAGGTGTEIKNVSVGSGASLAFKNKFTVSNLSVADNGLLQITSDVNASTVDTITVKNALTLGDASMLKIQLSDPYFATAKASIGDKSIAVLSATNGLSIGLDNITGVATVGTYGTFIPTFSVDTNNIYLTGFNFKGDEPGGEGHIYKLARVGSYTQGDPVPYGHVVKYDEDAKTNILYKVKNNDDKAWGLIGRGIEKREDAEEQELKFDWDDESKTLKPHEGEGDADILVKYNKKGEKTSQSTLSTDDTAYVGIEKGEGEEDAKTGAVTGDNIANVKADFIGNSANYGALYLKSNDVGTITGDFINNHAISIFQSEEQIISAQGGAIHLDGGSVNTITGDFIGNYALGDTLGGCAGGAIYNEGGTIGTITGDFIGNHAAYGGAIFLDGAGVVNVTGDFIGNYVKAGSYDTACGGAISNNNIGGKMEIRGSFIGNYAEGEYNAEGGAIENIGTIAILADGKDILFSGNTVSGSGWSINGGAISNRQIGSVLKLYASKDKSITFVGREGDSIVDSVYNGENAIIIINDTDRTDTAGKAYTGDVKFAKITNFGDIKGNMAAGDFTNIGTWYPVFEDNKAVNGAKVRLFEEEKTGTIDIAYSDLPFDETTKKFTPKYGKKDNYGVATVAELTLNTGLLRIQSNVNADTADRLETAKLVLGDVENPTLAIQIMFDPALATITKSITDKSIPVLTVTGEKGLGDLKIDNIVGVGSRGATGLVTPTFILSTDKKSVNLTGFSVIADESGGAGHRYKFAAMGSWTPGDTIPYGHVVKKDADGKTNLYKVMTDLDKDGKPMAWGRVGRGLDKDVPSGQQVTKKYNWGSDSLEEVDPSSDADIVVVYNGTNEKTTAPVALSAEATAYVGIKIDEEGNFNTGAVTGDNIADVKADFIGNSANWGALSLSNNDVGTITGDFINNYAHETVVQGEGGSILYLPKGGAIHIEGGTIGAINGDFIGNYSGGPTDMLVNWSEAGAIYNAGGTISAINGDFIGNHAANGGAIYNVSGNINVTGNFVGNYAATSGGAIYHEGGKINLLAKGQDISFIGNTASENGGAIYNAAGGTVKLYAQEGKSITFEGRDGVPLVDSVYNKGKLFINDTDIKDGDKFYTGAIKFAEITNEATGVIKGNVVAKNFTNEGTWYPVFDEKHEFVNETKTTLSNGGTIDIAYTALNTDEESGKLTPVYDGKKALDTATLSDLTIVDGALKIQSAVAKSGEAGESKADKLVVSNLTISPDSVLKITVAYDPYFTNTASIVTNPVAVLSADKDLTALTVKGGMAKGLTGGLFSPVLKVSDSGKEIVLTGFNWLDKVMTTSEALGEIGSLLDTDTFTMTADETLESDWGTFLERASGGKTLVLQGAGAGKNTVDGKDEKGKVHKGLVVNGEDHELTVDSITVKNMQNPFTVAAGTLTLKDVIFGEGTSGVIANDGTLNIEGTTAFSNDITQYDSGKAYSATTNFKKDFTLGESQKISQYKITIAEGTTLKGKINNLSVSSITNDGTLNLTGDEFYHLDNLSASVGKRGKVIFGSGTVDFFISPSYQDITTSGTLLAGRLTDSKSANSVTLNGAKLDITNNVWEVRGSNTVYLKDFAANASSTVNFEARVEGYYDYDQDEWVVEDAFNDKIEISGKASGTVDLSSSVISVLNPNYIDVEDIRKFLDGGVQRPLFTGGNLTGLAISGKSISASPDITYTFEPGTAKGSVKITAGDGLALWEAVNLKKVSDGSTPLPEDLTPLLSYALHGYVTLGDADSGGALPTEGTSLGTLAGEARNLTIIGGMYKIDGNNNSGVTVGSGKKLILDGLRVGGFKDAFITNSGTVEFSDNAVTLNYDADTDTGAKLTGEGEYVNNTVLYTHPSNLAANIKNNGTLEISDDSGVDGIRMISKNITGNGVTIIGSSGGGVTYTLDKAANITQKTIANYKNFVADLANLNVEAIANIGSLTLNGTGTLSASIYFIISGDSGTTVIGDGKNEAVVTLDKNATITQVHLHITDNAELKADYANLSITTGMSYMSNATSPFISNAGTLTFTDTKDVVIDTYITRGDDGVGTLNLGTGTTTLATIAWGATQPTIEKQNISTSGTLKTGKGHLDATDSVTLNGGTIDITDGTAAAMTAGNVVELKDFTATGDDSKIVFNTKLAQNGVLNDKISVTGIAKGKVNLALVSANISDEDFGVGDATIQLFTGGDLGGLTLVGQTITANAVKSYAFEPTANKGELKITVSEEGGCTLYDAINLYTEDTKAAAPTTYQLTAATTLFNDDTSEDAGAVPTGKTSLGSLARKATATPRSLTIDGSGFTLDGAKTDKASGFGGVTINDGDTLTIKDITVQNFNGAFVTTTATDETKFGTVKFTGTNTMKSAVTNDGAMEVSSGSTTFASGVSVSGEGSLVNKGSLTIDADKLTLTGDVTNEGTLTFTGGTTEARAELGVTIKDSTTGTVAFGDGNANAYISNANALNQSAINVAAKADVTNTGKLTAKTLINAGTLSAAIDDLAVAEAFTNSGTLETSGEVNKLTTLTNSGTVKIASGKTLKVTADKNLGGTLDMNSATLDMQETEGEAAYATLTVDKLKGNGTLKINANANESEKKADKIVYTGVDTAATVNLTNINLAQGFTEQATKDNPVEKDDWLTVLSGGSGATFNVGTTGEIKTQLGNFSYTFTKGTTLGKLKVISAYNPITLTEYISGAEKTKDLTSYSFETDETLAAGVTTGAIKPSYTINMNGMDLKAGESRNNGITVSNGKTLEIDGKNNTSNNGVIASFATALTVDTGGTLEIKNVNFSDNTTDISNAGTLNMSGTNTFGSKITGTGTATNTGTVNIAANNLGIALTNDGILTLTGGADAAGRVALASNVTSSATTTKGTVNFGDGANNAYISNAKDLTQKDILVDKKADVTNTGTLTADTITNKGKLETNAGKLVTSNEIKNDGTLALTGGKLAQLVDVATAGQKGTIDLQAATNIAAEINNQDIKLSNGYSKVADETYISNTDLTFNGGGFDFRNYGVEHYVVKNINLTGNGNLMLDVDLANKLMDTLNVAEGGAVTGSGKLHVTALTLLSDAKQNKTNIAFTETDALKGHVVSDVTHVASDMWKYLVAYDEETGEFAFTKNGRNEPDKPEVSETVMSVSDTANAINLAWLEATNTLQKRLGDLRGGEASNTGWARFERSNDDHNGARKLNVSGNLYQLGYDIALKNDTTARGYFGLSLERFDGSQSYKIGGGDVKSTSLSAYYTKIYDSGHYFDFIFRYGRYESDTTSYDAGLSTKLDYGMNGVTLSGEYGYRANIGKNGFYFEPQAEVIYGYLAGAKKTSSRGILADIDSTNHFVTRLGVALGKKVKNFNYYLRGSYYHDFAGSTNILYGDASYKQDSARNWWELSLGGGWNMTDASYFYAELTKHFKDVSNSINFNLGFRFTL
ncbi:MAG: autotransporter outer membrane beta-barrel domain-containing protein [Synergistaceae bacterium]|nr:autotransporter outer membrane beta-barrel domain-containing protein [Synergistaceae bacterium]